MVSVMRISVDERELLRMRLDESRKTPQPVLAHGARRRHVVAKGFLLASQDRLQSVFRQQSRR
jgi:hypothetical protein